MPTKRIKQTSTYKKLNKFLKKYEKWVLPLALVLGFLFDVFTFRSLDVFTSFVLLWSHALAVVVTIIFLNLYKNGKSWTKTKLFSLYYSFAPVILQFSFGALLSAVFIFYSFSASFAVSWPVLILLAGLMIGNEGFRKYYSRPIVQFNLFFLVLFLLMTLSAPFLFRSISPWVFVLAGLFALLINSELIKFLSRSVPEVNKNLKKITHSTAFIYLFINALYLLNIIPPVPLSLLEANVAYDLQRSSGNYKIEEVKESFFEKLIPGQKIKLHPGDPLYLFTSVSAPASLEAGIVHHWQHKDEKGWMSRQQVNYPIFGGRQLGYRGFSYRDDLEEGKWRVFIETSRGQVLGKVDFEVVNSGDEYKFNTLLK